jgi:glutamate synthase (NADPH/NADH) large chain
MSGGTAYVLDLDTDRVNAELVELRPLDELDPPEVEEVRELVRRHGEETGSTVAEALLDDWAAAAPRFTQIIPSNYRRVLAARAAAEEQGLDEAATTAAMMEAATSG